MRGLVTILAALIATLAGVTAAHAEQQKVRRVEVRVVDVGGGRAFLTPGQAGGLGEGTEVLFKRLQLKVAAVSSSYAVVELGEHKLSVGKVGVALVPQQPEEATQTPEIVRPPQLEQYQGLWGVATHPANDQHPKSIPLGRVRPRRADLALSLGVGATIPINGRASILRGELRARLRSEPITGVPFRIDADIAGQFWYATDLDSRDGGDSRPYVQVRALQLSYGEQHSFYTAVGRLRYAATTLGMLDGIRIQTPSLRGFTIEAFGGLVPHPFTGVPEWQVGRFGVEAAYRNPTSQLRPMIALVTHGSVFENRIDERRLSLTFALYPGESRIGAHAEVSFHDQENPWNVSVAELSAAGVDGSYRVSWFEIGGRFDMRRPERSLWLDSMLPQGWLCTATVTNTGEPEPCAGGDDTRYFASLDTGARFRRGSVHAGATLLHFAATEDLDQVGGFLQGQLNRIFGFGRVGMSLMLSRGSLVDSYAGRVNLGGSFSNDAVHVSLHYRVSYSQYEADIDGWWGHLVGGAVVVRPVPDLSFSLQADGIVGRDVDAVLLQFLTTWAPAF